MRPRLAPNYEAEGSFELFNLDPQCQKHKHVLTCLPFLVQLILAFSFLFLPLCLCLSICVCSPLDARGRHDFFFSLISLFLFSFFIETGLPWMTWNLLCPQTKSSVCLFQVLVNEPVWVLGTRSGSYRRSASIPKGQASSLAPSYS